jgi:fatty acid desaturase
MDKQSSLSLVLPPTNPDRVTIVDTERTQVNREYAQLKHLLKNKGLLEKQPVYYTYRIALLLVLLLVGIVSLVLFRNFWLQMFDAVYLAFVFTQIGLLSHEAGHRQMFHELWKHDLLALVGGNFLLGMSYGWWLDKHNTHHSHPNQIDMDPDLDIPFLEFTGTEDLATIGKLRQFLVKHQRLIFLPALMIVSVGLQANSVRFLFQKRAKYQRLESILMLAHFVCYFAFVFVFVGFLPGLLFILIHQALTGLYLGSIFAPNHKGMPMVEKESDMTFFHRQVLTSRNIYAHPVTDFVYGGLNYQIEHHLFPGMPRNKLKAAQPIVRTFCEEHLVSYHETTAPQSLAEILSYLHAIGAPLREGTLVAPKS